MFYLLHFLQESFKLGVNPFLDLINLSEKFFQRTTDFSAQA